MMGAHMTDGCGKPWRTLVSLLMAVSCVLYFALPCAHEWYLQCCLQNTWFPIVCLMESQEAQHDAWESWRTPPWINHRWVTLAVRPQSCEFAWWIFHVTIRALIMWQVFFAFMWRLMADLWHFLTFWFKSKVLSIKTFMLHIVKVSHQLSHVKV